MNTHATLDDTDVVLLGLRSVLVGSLPATLLTDDAPERYTVEAVFTRKPEAEEIERILDEETRAYLSEHGYPAVEVSVSDRRLEVANTTLEELRDGLGIVLARRLADISVQVRARREIAATEFREASDLEQHRAATVAALAESVTFTRPAQHMHGPEGAHSRAGTAADRVQVEEWLDEGGAARR